MLIRQMLLIFLQIDQKKSQIHRKDHFSYYNMDSGVWTVSLEFIFFIIEFLSTVPGN